MGFLDWIFRPRGSDPEAEALDADDADDDPLDQPAPAPPPPARTTITIQHAVYVKVLNGDVYARVVDLIGFLHKMQDAFSPLRAVLPHEVIRPLVKTFDGYISDALCREPLRDRRARLEKELEVVRRLEAEADRSKRDLVKAVLEELDDEDDDEEAQAGVAPVGGAGA